MFNIFLQYDYNLKLTKVMHFNMKFDKKKKALLNIASQIKLLAENSLMTLIKTVI